MPSGNGKLQWAPKVAQIKIRRLYELDAWGIIDVDLIDEVGRALWERCDSILTGTAAHYGHVLCPACGTVIERPNPWSADEYVACAKCIGNFHGRCITRAIAASNFSAPMQWVFSKPIIRPSRVRRPRMKKWY